MEVLLAGRLRRRARVVRVGEQALEQRRGSRCPAAASAPSSSYGRAGEVAARRRRAARCRARRRRRSRRPSGSRSRRGSARPGPGRPASRSASSSETSGAPWPPAATSRARRSETTGTPVRSAIHAGWPTCSVPFDAPVLDPVEQRLAVRGDQVDAPKRSTAAARELRERLADPRVQPAHASSVVGAAAARPRSPPAGRRRTAR